MKPLAEFRSVGFSLGEQSRAMPEAEDAACLAGLRQNLVRHDYGQTRRWDRSDMEVVGDSRGLSAGRAIPQSLSERY